MKRYPDSFYVEPIVETREGSDFFYETDEEKPIFEFDGRITDSLIGVSGVQGDMKKVTHEIYAGKINYSFQIGETIVHRNSNKSYELIYPRQGQKITRLWLASI